MTALQDAVTALTAQVAAEAEVESSAIVLIQGLIAQVQAGIDQGSIDAIQAAVTAMKSNAAALATAVATPGAGGAINTDPVVG